MRALEVILSSLAVMTLTPSTAAFSSQMQMFEPVSSGLISASVLTRFLSSHDVKRFQIVTVDTNALRLAIREASRLEHIEEANPITFDIFEDLALTLWPTLVQDENPEFAPSTAFWSGDLKSDGEFFASVGLHLNSNDEVRGNFRTSLGRIRIEPTEELPYHIVWLQDFSGE